jgi:MbtH protein
MNTEDVRVTEATTDDRYLVVVNHEEQYSIWPALRELPLGWKAVGEPRSKEDCLSYIEEVWTDMAPLSLRKAMEKQGAPGKKRKKRA